jgi:hypothetical protein
LYKTNFDSDEKKMDINEKFNYNIRLGYEILGKEILIFLKDETQIANKKNISLIEWSKKV